MNKKTLQFLRRSAYTATYIISSVKKQYIEGFILCYHSISEDGWEFSISKDVFKKHIEFLLSNYQPCSMTEFEEYLEGSLTFSKPFFMISFDDGNRNINTVKDYLKSKDIKPILFLLSDAQNTVYKELDNEYELLNLEEIKALKKDGWELGSHSATHADFWDLSSEQIKKEIIQSKNELEEELGSKIEYFAYPKGRYSDAIKSVVKEAGYKLAFSMDSRLINRDMDKFSIPRIGVMKSHSFMEFKSLPLALSTKMRNCYFQSCGGSI